MSTTPGWNAPSLSSCVPRSRRPARKSPPSSAASSGASAATGPRPASSCAAIGTMARPEVMYRCDAEGGVDYLFGLPMNAAAAGSRHRDDGRCLRRQRINCETTYAAGKWSGARRSVIARIEAITLGLDIRAVVTSLTGSDASLKASHARKRTPKRTPQHPSAGAAILPRPQFAKPTQTPPRKRKNWRITG
jgi:hypothetical protein